MTVLVTGRVFIAFVIVNIEDIRNVELTSEGGKYIHQLTITRDLYEYGLKLKC